MRLFKKSSPFYPIFNFKCPRCHEGRQYETGAFSFRKSFDMYDRCSVCGQDFEPEPGFYYGAMFISYIFTGFFCLGFVALVHWLIGWDLETSFAALIAVCAFFFVYTFRLARSIWLGLNVKYDPKATN